jgi:hypothetical protein
MRPVITRALPRIWRRSAFRTPRVLGHAVPMYIHPILAPGTWRALAGSDLGAGFAVANTADGPGAQPEAAYQEALGALLAAGTPMTGYLDWAYGERDPAALLTDLERWRRWYGITGVFLDRVASHPGQPQDAVRLIDQLRAGGATRVIVNPGVPPVPWWCEVADGVITFEGSWADHRRHVPPGWMRDVAPERLCHLVHSVPPGVSAPEVAARVAAAGAGIAGVSHESMPNPWTGSIPLAIS